MAESTSLMWDRNLLPKPSPLEAPLTSPAISTNSIVVFIFFFEFDISTSLSNRSSGTVTTPTFGSIVQKGKLAACALLEFVSALNSVYLPTLGNPTIPHLKLIYLLFTVLENKSNFLSISIDTELIILFVTFSNCNISSSLKSFNTWSETSALVFGLPIPILTLE